MRSLSRRRKVFHDFSWNIHDFSWILHDFPCWLLRSAQAEGRVGAAAACDPHRPYARGAINEKAAI